MAKRHHIAVVLRLNLTDCRARLSGILRFLATRNNIDVRVLDATAPSFRQDCERLAAGWPVDGLICTFPSDIKRLINLRKRQCLAVMDGPRDFRSEQVEVRMDTRKLTDATVELFRRRGFANLAFCGTEDPFNIQFSEETEAFFIQSAGPGSSVGVFHEKSELSYSDNLACGAKWAASLPKPCAVMCYSDVLARNLLNACNLAHVKVPEQVAIIGMDNTTEICEMTRPTLSSILPDFELSGYLAAEGLCRALTRSGVRQIRRSYGLRTIVERSSTQDLRGCGRIVNAAMELIRLTPLAEISADYISRNLHVSRRLLELHFKKVLGYGVHAAICRSRLDGIHKQLLSTSRPIGAIVEDSGYKTITAARVAFRKRYGLSMRELRGKSDCFSNELH